MIQACLCFLAGAFALQLISFGKVSDRVAVTLFATSVMFVLRRPVPGIALLSGLVVFQLEAIVVVDTRLDDRYAGDSMLVELKVVDFPRQSGESLSLLAESLDDPRVPPRIRLSWFRPGQVPRIGEIWQFEVRLRPPQGTANPGGFDFESWLFRERIGATGYVVDGRRNQRLEAATDWLTRTRQAMVDRIERRLGQTPEAAVISAVSVGARHRITRDQWSRYAASGTSHLMAISGLHIGLAAGAAYLALRCLAAVLVLPGNTRRLAIWGALVVAAAYAVVAGFAIPAQRATLMLSVAAIGLASARRLHPFRILALTALTAAIIDPLATMAPGYRFSYVAVLALLWLAARSRDGTRAGALERLSGRCSTLGQVQLLLLFGLLPLSVLEFGRLSLHAPFVNLLAVPLFSVVSVPAVLLGLALDGPLQGAGDVLLDAAAASIRLLEQLLDVAANLPGSDIRPASVESIAWFALLAAPCLAVCPPGWPGRNVAWLGLVFLVAWRPSPPPPGCIDVTFLDVGQGLSVVLQTHRHVALYDTGPAFSTGTSLAERVVVPFFVSRGIHRVDRLIVSHDDIDHAGGVDVIVTELDVSRIIAGETTRRNGIPQQFCRRGDGWYWDGVRFVFLHPASQDAYAGNNASCVLSISAGRSRILLTGDIEAPAERMLIARGVPNGTDVVSVPHHGSRTSSTQALVARLSPTLAIVSSAPWNRWGLPHAPVIARWNDAGSAIAETGRNGAIGVRACDGADGIRSRYHRSRSKSLWHASRR